MLKSDKVNDRLGAVIALGQLRNRAVPALNAIAALLNDDDRWVRVQAAEALRVIGPTARPVLPQMLKAAAVKDKSDPMEFGVGALAYALFYPGGSYGPRGILAGSIAEVDKKSLYPAIRSVATNPDSHARGCLRSTYNLLTIEDVKILAPEFYASVRDMAPANTMFSKGVRLAGAQAMARLRIEEGLHMAIMLINLREWGRNYVTDVSLGIIKQYRGAAKLVLPELEKLKIQWQKERRGAWLKKLAEIMATIDNDKNPPRLISLKEYMGKNNVRRNG
jgi:hypothetical protein